MNLRFEEEIPVFMDRIRIFFENFNKFDCGKWKVHWKNPKLKSLNSMPGNDTQITIGIKWEVGNPRGIRFDHKF